MIGKRLQRPIDWDSIHQCWFNQLSSKTSHSVSFERNEFGTLARNLNPASVRELSEKLLCHERESKGSREIDRKSEKQSERSSARDGKMSTCLTAKMSVWVATLEGFKTWELMRQHLVRWEISFPSLPFSVLFSFLSTLHRHARTSYKYVHIYTLSVYNENGHVPGSHFSIFVKCMFSFHLSENVSYSRQAMAASWTLLSYSAGWVEISFGFTGSLCYFSFYSVYFPGSGSGSGIGLLTQ